MNFDEICALIELVAKKGIPLVEVEHEGVRVKVQGGGVEGRPAAPLPPVLSPPAPAAAPPSAASVSAVPAPTESDPSLHLIVSPMVGTFYRAPSPQSEPFAKPGDRVRKGQVLCIIEAMKLMNEIESDADGVVVEVFPQNAQPVEFGERLFALKV